VPDPDAIYLAEDARDRRDALAAASLLATSGPHRVPWDRSEATFASDWLALADRAYRWLRNRASLVAVAVSIIPGTPYPEGTTPVTTTFNLADTDEVVFSLTGLDAKGATVPLPPGFSAAWSLADPDSTGAVLTPSADNTTAALSAGVPDSNLMVSTVVTITSADGSTTTLNGAEAVVVQAGDAVTVGIVPGTPTPEAPPATA